MRKFNSYKEEQEFKQQFIERLAIVAGPGAQIRANGDGEANGIKYGDTEAAFYVGYDAHHHRFEISGVYPQSRVDGSQFYPSQLYSPQVSSPSITVNADKSPEQIAKDIARRFLPDYRAVLARCLEARDNHDSYIRNSNSLAKELADILGEKPSGRSEAERQHIHLSSLKKNFYGDFHVSGDSISVDLRSLNPDQARKLAAFIIKL